MPEACYTNGMIKEIKVDPAKCIGCGSCAALAYQTFRMTKEGKSEVIKLRQDDEEMIRQAVECCPTGAIEIIQS